MATILTLFSAAVLPAMLRLRTLLLLCIYVQANAALGAEPNLALNGYANHAAFMDRIGKLDQSDLVAVSSLGKTAGGRDVQLLTIGVAEAARRPAIAIVGGVDATHLTGSELALRMAEQIVAKSGEEGVKRLLESVTLYVIPRADPDSLEKSFAVPHRIVAGNSHQTDDDRDGKAGEDPPEDLNGDDLITMLRVEDPSGSWMPHPADPRVLIEADVKKNERGKYRLLTEGRDNDGDEQWNEDAGDGVAFDRNWPHRYQPFMAGTGPNAVSEPESRAVADFLYDHTNVFAAFVFAPQDNLFHTWKPDAGKDKAKIRSTILSGDAPYADFLAGKYRDLHGGKDTPESPWPGGTFAEWSYFQYGRWTFSARGWWVPKVAEGEGDPKAGDEKRGADDLNALRWLAQEKIAGFVDWQKIEHPDFPGTTVEVGGFKPFIRENAPVAMLDDLARKQLSFLVVLAEHRPRIGIQEAKVDSLGAGVYRVTAKVASTGYLPSLPEMGEVTGIHQRMQIQLAVPKGTQFLKGSPRVKLGRIDATGAKEAMWLVRLADGKGEGMLKAWSPEVGEVEQAIRFE